MGMTDRIVRPVRAWADYDEWSLFARDPMEHSGQYWKFYCIPNGAKGEPYVSTKPGVTAILKFMEDQRIGALRSLRVLYENGYELKLECYANINGLDITKRHWHWYLKGVDCAGEFAEDKDSEAVERAMIAASAWFTQAEGL
jgi:hypothetical protein